MPTELLASRAGGRTFTALREDGVTAELRVEDDSRGLAVGHIVKARVSKILPGIQSAFLDVGAERDAFLHATDLLLPGETASPRLEALSGGPGDEAEEDRADAEAESEGTRRPRRDVPDGPPIQERLKEGREIVVQVVREGFGAKGARVTSFITLPGRTLVHAPQAPFRGISRRIHDPGERERLRGILEEIQESEGGFIVRTAGAGASPSALAADARFLAGTWRSIERRIERAPTPSVLHADLDLFFRTLRDAPTASLDRIVVDDAAMERSGAEYLREIDPVLAARLTRHEGPPSLFDATGVTADIERALRPRVWLPSGGTIVIEPTEALVSIDVNTGKFVGIRRMDETVLKTNVEAAEEIARQLRLRDLGGIIVVDFIDMDRPDHRQLVLSTLERALQRDRSRTKIVGLSELGLLQLTRKRTRLGLGAVLTRGCVACGATGRMKTPETVAHDALVEALRVAASFPASEISIHAHPDVARAIELVLQTPAPVVDRDLARRLRIADDPGSRPEQFDVRAR